MTSDKDIRQIEADIERSKAVLLQRWQTLGDEIAAIAGTAKRDVTDTVQQTVRDAKDAVSLQTQVARRPWSMFGASVAAGVLLSRALRGGHGVGLARALSQNALTGATIMSGLKMLSSVKDGLLAGSEGSGISGPAGSVPFERAVPVFGTAASLSDTIRKRAVNSLTDLARGLTRQHVPPSLAPAVNNVIARAESKLLSVGAPATAPVGQRRVINESGESVLPH